MNEPQEKIEYWRQAAELVNKFCEFNDSEFIEALRSAPAEIWAHSFFDNRVKIELQIRTLDRLNSLLPRLDALEKKVQNAYELLR